MAGSSGQKTKRAETRHGQRCFWVAGRRGKAAPTIPVNLAIARKRTAGRTLERKVDVARQIDVMISAAIGTVR